MEKKMEKKTTPEVKKVYAVTVKFDRSSTATIYKAGMPFIVDTVNSTVKTLYDNFKEADIEIVGDKPECWKTYFPDPAIEPPAEAIPEATTAIEPPAEAPVTPETPVTTETVEKPE